MEILLFSAFSIGILHALAPDHWLPFVVLGKAQKWNRWKTTRVVSLAGLGHVGSSVVITVIGLAIGAGLDNVSGWEELRGNAASSLLIGFGAIYAVWGIFHLQKHTHNHTDNVHHAHVDDKAAIVSYWTLVALIVFGPCEPLIPLLFASTTLGWMAVGLVFIVFGIVTIAMMLLQVHLSMLGLSFLRMHFAHDASHIAAGIIIVFTGIAIRVLGI